MSAWPCLLTAMVLV